ncbi:glycosyltransferase family 4 protein [Afifella sp. IM 167]|uniref:glycosyltransferase family 4 protein n=1 Tax=Afifella sp. IM 167 TaxID=2033586 RepID=UPI001CC9D0A8|nr:MraY family glycosyltransferase [Afifella sp. IM 167]MBZ8134432.1 undecaprenyl-phosphate alpha-N-acetylglucosaminyl 1-phosphate transferase [Afifella sp. IM 167]
MAAALEQMFNAFFLSALLILWLRGAAPALGLVDRPDLRKQHDGIVPLCGGIGIFFGAGLPALMLPEPLRIHGHVLLGLGLLLLVGAADDRWCLPPWPRLLSQTLAAAILIWPLTAGRVELGFPPPSAVEMLMPPILLVFAVGTMNSFNMMDGIDGLAGTAGLAALLWLTLIASHFDRADLVAQSLVLLSALLAFIAFNLRHPWRSRASVFLGDAGSVTLGGAIAWLVIALATGPEYAALPGLLWVVALPSAETLSLIVRRIRRGRSPLLPDREHLHHLLIDNGVSPAGATGLIALASALCGGIGWIAIVSGAPSPLVMAGLAVPIAAHAWVIRRLSRPRDVLAALPQGVTTPAAE